MNEQFSSKIERSSFGSTAAKAARNSVPSQKSQSLVARAAATQKISKKDSGRARGTSSDRT